MASIGEVSATLKADIGQYVGPMQQAAQATAQVQSSVESATNALLKEGAAGEAAGKGVASFGASTQALAQQLAAAEGRLTQLQSAFTTLGIQPAGREFAKASEEVARLRSQLALTAPAAAQLAQAQSQVVPALTRLQTGSQGASKGLLSMRGSLANLASTAAGIPGPLGSIASKFLVFGVGGPATVALLAGLAAIGAAFSKWRETVQKETEAAATIWERTLQRMRSADKFIELVEEREEAMKRLTRATAALAAAQVPGRRVVAGRGDRVIIEETPIDPAQVAVARLRLDEAKKALEAIGRAVAGVRGEIQKTAQGLADEARALEEAHKRAFIPSAEQAEAKDALDKYLESMRQLKLAEDAAFDRRVEIRTEESEKRIQELQDAITRMKDTLRETEETLATKPTDQAKADTSIKDSLKDSQQDAVATARELANSLARAFTDAFSDNEKSMMERIASVLSAALKAAMEKIIAQKLFEGFLAAITGGGSKGVAGDIPVIGDLFSAFSAPSMPSPEAVGTGMGTVIVPLENLPRPLGPIEQARDAMWQAVWVETARAAQQNGVSLQPRFR